MCSSNTAVQNHDLIGLFDHDLKDYQFRVGGYAALGVS